MKHYEMNQLPKGRPNAPIIVLLAQLQKDRLQGLYINSPDFYPINILLQKKDSTYTTPLIEPNIPSYKLNRYLKTGRKHVILQVGNACFIQHQLPTTR